VIESKRSPGRSTPNNAAVIAWVPLTNCIRTAACLSPKNPGKHSIHQITALISMAVASEGSKVLRPQPLRSKRSQNTLQALFHRRCSLRG
jgi:hypothetical protein